MEGELGRIGTADFVETESDVEFYTRPEEAEQFVRETGVDSAYDKRGTPTMGGVLIVGSIALSTLLWSDLSTPFIWIALLVLVGFGLIGFIDDYLMQIKKQSKGLSVRGKLALQAVLAMVAGVLVCATPQFSTEVTVPFFKTLSPDLGWGYVLFAMLVIVGASNAVNLTDGLDGLAIGPMSIAAATYMIFAYVAGHARIATYLQITYVPGCGELTVFCGAIAGAGLGFLWFNAYPAQVFMGDTGSLSLGAALGVIAVITKQEILLVLVGGLFVIEALSDALTQLSNEEVSQMLNLSVAAVKSRIHRARLFLREKIQGFSFATN